jgi:hypothetical protein
VVELEMVAQVVAAEVLAHKEELLELEELVEQLMEKLDFTQAQQ